MSHGSSILRARFSIASLMVLVAISALIALGIRHFGAAITAGLAENYMGDGNSQDMEVLGEVVPALVFISLAGACGGIAVKRGANPWILAFLKRWKWLVTLLSGPTLLLAFFPLPVIIKQVAWGGVFFVDALLLAACWNFKPSPHRLNPDGTSQQPETLS